MREQMHVRIVPMTGDHLDEVAELERICFTTPWSRNMLVEELQNDCAAFLVALDDEDHVAGYAGLLVVLDEENNPVACEKQAAQVLRDGVVVDYTGALRIVRSLKEKLEARLGTELVNCAIAMPAGTESSVKTHQYVAEGAGLEVTNILDEPSAANAIYQNLSFIDRYDPKYVIILSGDQICKQDYSDFLRFHKEKNAEFSVAVMEVPWSEASRFGLMVTDEDDRINAFQEKPKEPKSNLASMGIYIFNWDILKKYLSEDEADPNSENDFGKNVIPNLLKDGRRMYAYHFSGYWKDVGTISSLWQANMEVLDPKHSGINLFDENWKIYSRNTGRPCQQIGSDATISNSMISEGCKVNGTVNNSILFPGAVVEKGATVEAAVVMGGTVIKAGASVKHCIVAENVTIEEGATVGAMPEGGLNIAEPGDVATVGSGVVIGKGAVVGPKAMVSSDVKDGEEQW